MTAIYVLFIFSWFSGYASGYAVATQEFSSRQACEAAAASVKAHNDGGEMQVWCVQK